jgi:hypothetical protein
MAASTESGSIDLDDYLKTVDAAASSLYQRGLVADLAPHVQWMIRCRAVTYSQEKLESDQSFPLFTGVPILGRLTMRIKHVADAKMPSGRGEATLYADLPVLRKLSRAQPLEHLEGTQVNATLVLAQVFSNAVNLVFGLVRRLPAAVVRQVWTALRETLRSVPPLLVAVVVVFITGDGWKVFGRSGLDRRGLVFVGFVVVLSLMFAGHWRFDELTKDVHDLTPPEQEPSAAGDRLRAMLAPHTPVLPMPRTADRMMRLNIRILYWVAVAVDLIAVGASVFVGLLIVGTIRFDYATTHDLLGDNPHVLWTIPSTDWIVTRELVAVSVSLAAIAMLFAAAALQQTESRRLMLGRTLGKLSYTLHIYAYYLYARENVEQLTSIRMPGLRTTPAAKNG